MATRKVYLGRVDIDQAARIDLKHHDSLTDGRVLLYIFRYGILADEVSMQWSAPLKSKQVLNAYFKLGEAFKRNENHEPTPIFTFSLNDVADGYFEYLSERYVFLKKLGDEDNAESVAYRKNQAKESARKLDGDLAAVDVPRRKKSVSAIFRNGLWSALRANDPKKTGVSDETAGLAINAIKESEEVQTFNLVSSLGLKEVNQANALYEMARACYRQANAASVNAINSDDLPVWAIERVAGFCEAIGIHDLLRSTKSISAELLFKIRGIESFKILRDEYFNAQSDAELAELNVMLRTLRVNGRVRSVMRKSPSAITILIFEALSEAKINYWPLKAFEALSRKIVSDRNEHFAMRCHRFYGLIRELNYELSELAHKAG